MMSTGASGTGADAANLVAVQALARPRHRRPGTDPGRAGRAGNAAGSNAAREERLQRQLKAQSP